LRDRDQAGRHDEQLGAVVALLEQQIAAPEAADRAGREQKAEVFLTQVAEEVGVGEEGALDHRPARLPLAHGRLTAVSAAAAFDDEADTAIGVWAIVVAVGAGSRFGGAKQYALLGGKRVVDWSLATARASCAEVILVVPPDRADAPEAAD